MYVGQKNFLFIIEGAQQPRQVAIAGVERNVGKIGSSVKFVGRMS